jgi:hypothetical protein
MNDALLPNCGQRDFPGRFVDLSTVYGVRCSVACPFWHFPRSHLTDVCVVLSRSRIVMCLQYIDSSSSSDKRERLIRVLQLNCAARKFLVRRP